MHYILFDLDGTLTQTYYGDDNSYIRALSEQLPIRTDYAYWHDCPHLTDSAVLDHIYHKVAKRPPAPHEVEAMRTRFLGILEEKSQTHPEFFHPLPGAVELVQHLTEKEDVQVGVATGGWEAVAHYKLQKAGFPTDRLEIIGSDHHHAKTDFVLALIDRITSNTQREPSTIHYIGDSGYDMKAAALLNINFIGVDHKGTGYLQSVGARQIVPHYEDRGRFLELVGLR